MTEKRVVPNKVSSAAAKFLRNAVPKGMLDAIAETQVAEIHYVGMVAEDFRSMQFHGKSPEPVSCLAVEASGKTFAIIVPSARNDEEYAGNVQKLMNASGLASGEASGEVRRLTADELAQFAATSAAKVFIDYSLMGKPALGMVASAPKSGTDEGFGILTKPDVLMKAFDARPYFAPLRRK